MLGRTVAIATMVLALGACSQDAVGPTAGALARASDSTGSPTFLRAAAGAPTIANPVIAFYAKKGVNAEVKMLYNPEPGKGDSALFLDFRVDDRSLAFRPDGTPIAQGDSVLITLTLVDASHGIVDFQPAGLRFSADKPARLKLNFLEADSDYNGDGVVNQTDKTLTHSFSVWKRESSADPWVRLSSVVDEGTDDVNADILGFTSYSIGF